VLWRAKLNSPGLTCPVPGQEIMEGGAYGKIVVLKRSGQDSASFELIDEKYTFGR
jgi:hypothetical protein